MMPRIAHRFARPRGLGAIALTAALLAPSVAVAKDLRTTVCGQDGCRVAVTPLAGVATTGHAPLPRRGRFFTLRLSFGSRDIPGFTLIYERRAQLVRAGDRNARTFLGTGWHRLDVSLRRHYAAAVRGRVARPAP